MEHISWTKDPNEEENSELLLRELNRVTPGTPGFVGNDADWHPRICGTLSDEDIYAVAKAMKTLGGVAALSETE